MVMNSKSKVTWKKSQLDPTNPNHLILSGKYDQAIVLLRKMLRQSPDCHWGWFQLASAYHETKKYTLSLRYAQKSLVIEPNCPLALWHYAGAVSHIASVLNVDYEENIQKSYDIYKRLLKIGIRGLDRMNCCNEGHDANVGLINDCRLSMGLCAYGMSKYKEAKRWTNLFISNHDGNSIYTKKFGIRVLKSIEKYEH